jgi:hypothetical protein
VSYKVRKDGKPRKKRKKDTFEDIIENTEILLGRREEHPEEEERNWKIATTSDKTVAASALKGQKVKMLQMVWLDKPISWKLSKGEKLLLQIFVARMRKHELEHATHGNICRWRKADLAQHIRGKDIPKGFLEAVDREYRRQTDVLANRGYFMEDPLEEKLDVTKTNGEMRRYIRAKRRGALSTWASELECYGYFRKMDLERKIYVRANHSGMVAFRFDKKGVPYLVVKLNKRPEDSLRDSDSKEVEAALKKADKYLKKMEKTPYGRTKMEMEKLPLP